MSEIRQHREQPDLIKMITELQRRIVALENSRRLGNASIDGGELTVRGGDVVVRNTNSEEVLRVKHGSAPTILMTPDFGLDAYVARMLAWESEGQGAAVELGIRTSGDQQDGGKLLLMQGASFLTHTPNGGEEGFFSISSYADATFYFRGKWEVGEQHEATDGLVFGVESVAAGFGAASVGFVVPFATAPFFMYTILSAVGPVSHNLVSISNTGFTVGWSGTTAKTIYWQAWRQ